MTGQSIGTARVVIAFVSLFLALLCVVVAVVTLRANGVLVLATIFCGVYGWAAGVFSRAYWVADGPSDRSRLDELDGK